MWNAFLVEPEHVGPPLADFLADGVEGRSITDAAEEEDVPESHYPPSARSQPV